MSEPIPDDRLSDLAKSLQTTGLTDQVWRRHIELCICELVRRELEGNSCRGDYVWSKGEEEELE